MLQVSTVCVLTLSFVDIFCCVYQLCSRPASDTSLPLSPPVGLDTLRLSPSWISSWRTHTASFAHIFLCSVVCALGTFLVPGMALPRPRALQTSSTGHGSCWYGFRAPHSSWLRIHTACVIRFCGQSNFFLCLKAAVVP